MIVSDLSVSSVRSVPGRILLRAGAMVLLLAGLGTSSPAQGQSPPPIVPQARSQQAAGSTFWIDVQVGSSQRPVTDLFGISFALTYDTSHVDVLDDEPGPFLGSDVVYTSSVSPDSGTVGIGLSRKRGRGGVDGAGVVARVKVEVDDDVPEGTVLSHGLTEVSANDADGNDVSLSLRSRDVTVASAIRLRPSVRRPGTNTPLDDPPSPGDTIAIDVNVGSAQVPVSDLFGTSFALTYAPRRVDILDDEPGSFLGSDVVYTSNVRPTPGEVGIGLSRKASTAGRDGTGTVARVTARIAPNADPGTPLTFGLRNAQAINPADSSIGLDVRPRTVSLASSLRLTVSRSTLPYGRVGVADTSTRSVRIANRGETTLPLTLSFADGPSFAVPGDTARTLKAGQADTTAVAFVPAGKGSWRDTLRVEVPDSLQAAPLASVALTGTGVSVEVNEPTVDVSTGESPSLTVTIPDDFNPTTAALYARRAGAPSYRRTTFTPSGDSVAVDVPTEVLSERGVQYWLRLAEPPAQGSTRPGPDARVQDSLVVTFPPKNPRTQPSQIRTRVSDLPAAGPFPERTYRMVSVPLNLDDRSLSSVFPSQYGGYDPSEWRLARYTPSVGTYREYPALDTAALRPGRAYWLTTREGTGFTIDRGRSVDVTGPDTLVVKPGWNQIATPFAFPVAWSDVRGTGPIDEVVGYDPSQPRGERYQYGASVLRPWRGAFVYNTAEEPVRLSVPPREAPDTVGANAALASKGASSPGAGPASSYRLRIDAAHDTGDETLRDRQTRIGFRKDARTGVGTEDHVEVPPIGEHLRVSVAPEEGPLLAESLKPVGEQGQSWDLTVSARVREPFFSAKTVRLRFDEDGQRPGDFGRYVLDLDRGTRLPVEDGAATIRLTKERPTRHLRVIVGTRALARSKAAGIPLEVLETTLKPPYPNPVSETATIAYEVKTERPVTIAVYDVLGRRVQTLVHAKREAGHYQVEWPGSRSGGDRLASGMYFVRMQAGGVSETRKVTLVR